MVRFSIIFATRGRINYLEKLLYTIQKTTRFPSKIEVIAVADICDKDTVPQIPRLEKEFQHINLFMPARVRSPWLNRDYISWAARFSRGKYVFVLNDDAKFTTGGWDEIAWDRLESVTPADGIILGNIVDGLQNRQNNFCCFPIVGRGGIETLGYVMHPGFPNWRADIHLWDLYAAVDRITNVPIEVLHLSKIGGGFCDGVNQEMQGNHWRYDSNIAFDTIDQDIAKLKECIQYCATPPS